MAIDRYVDSNATGLNDGTSMANAWTTIKAPAEAGSITAGTNVWVSRNHVEISVAPAAHIQPTTSGTPQNPIRIIGWPRAAHTIASSDWTQGSTAVVVNDANMSREKHLGRYVTAPDGAEYLITRVVDASNIVIDRPYVGYSALAASATIKADEDYSTRPTDTAGWDAIADDLPCIDFLNTNYTMYMYFVTCWHIKNIDFRDSIFDAGSLYFRESSIGAVTGCLFHTDNDSSAVLGIDASTVQLTRSVLTGSGAGLTQRGLYFNDGICHFKDVAVYGFGDLGIRGVDDGNTYFMENVNIGVEIANGNADISISKWANIYGRDVKLGGTNGYIKYIKAGGRSDISFENYGKVLGAHKRFTEQGTLTKLVADGTGDAPNQRTGGSADVIEILHDLSTASIHFPAPADDWWLPDIFVHEFEANTNSRTYRYYVQSMDSLTADQLWIECEYVDYYTDTSKYSITTVRSDESVTVRSSNSDWSQYIEVPNIRPAVGSKVRIRCKCTYQHATNKIFIDPDVSIF